MNFKFLIVLSLLFTEPNVQSTNDSFHSLLNNFEKEYNLLNIPSLELSYVNNLKNISSAEELSTQQQFFQKYQKQLELYPIDRLSEKNRVTFQVMVYEIDLNLERIDLEKKWLAGQNEIKGTRVYDEQLGKQWYAYFLKKWIDKTLTPDAAFQFGLKEIETVKLHMADIQNQMELDDVSFKKQWEDNQYLISNKREVLEKYNDLKLKVKNRAKHYFPDVDKIPSVQIAAGTNKDLAIVPAYYSNNTFYYNFFGETYDSRDMGWTFLHEAIPGHHYQHHIAAQQDRTLSHLFFYMGYVEGWGAYIEQFGRVLGAYSSPLDAYAQLNWDLIRSVRVALDVGLNYYGWSDERAMEFWNQHITDQEDIAKREIKRMKRWPAQVITYKYGKHILDELKGNKNTPEELKTFHQQVLEYGNLPLSVLRNHIQDKQNQWAQVDSVLICDVKFKNSKFNNSHAGSGFLLRYNKKVYGITAKHVLFFAKTDSMETVSFGDHLRSWGFTSKISSNSTVLAGKLVNENENEAIEMPPKGDWLIFEIMENVPKGMVVYSLREEPLKTGERVRFLGYPYKSNQPVNIKGTFIGLTKDNNLRLDVPRGTYGGCSGGPVLDAQGKLVGIVSMGYFNEKENQMIFEPAGLDYFIKTIAAYNSNLDSY